MKRVHSAVPIVTACILTVVSSCATAEDKPPGREQPRARSSREEPSRREAGEKPRERQPSPAQIERQIGELMRAGKTEEAEKLKRQLAQASRGREARPEAGRNAGHELEEMSKYHAELREQVGRLHKEGKHEEAEKVEQEANRVRERLGRMAPRRQPERRPEPSPEGAGGPQERLQHLRIAAENLHAAGQHDAARDIEQQIEAGEREFRQREPRGGPQPSPDGMIREMREQMEAMHREIRELREQLEDLRKQRR